MTGTIAGRDFPRVNRRGAGSLGPPRSPPIQLPKVECASLHYSDDFLQKPRRPRNCVLTPTHEFQIHACIPQTGDK